MVMQAYGDAGGRPVVAAIPIADLSLEQRRSFRSDVVNKALARAADRRVVNADLSNAVVRQLMPDTDLNFGAVTYNQWLTPPLVASTLLSIVNNTTVSIRQLICIYGISHNEPIPGLGEFRFSRGTSGAGGMMAIVDVAPGFNRWENEWYLSRAILFDPQDVIFIQAMPFITNALGERWMLHGYAIEALGDNIAIKIE
jgi:hypothetical protein